MCLYSFLTCLSRNPPELLRVLKTPPPEIIAAGLVRCRWYEALACKAPKDQDQDQDQKSHDSDEDSKSKTLYSRNKTETIGFGGRVTCPYLVIRHDDDYILEQEVQSLAEAVLTGGLSFRERGCQECWELAFRYSWVGRLPSEADKMKYLYTTNQVTDDSGGGSESQGGAGSGSAGIKEESGGLKRGRADEEETFDGATASAYRSVMAERALKRPRKESPESPEKRDRRRARSRRPSRSFPPVLTPSSSMTSGPHNSMSPEPPTDESEPAQSMVPENALRCESEVIPPRPDQINKTDSEDYEIHATSKFMNWNHGKDKLFANITPKGRYKGKRKSTSPEEEEGDDDDDDDDEDALQASRRQMAAELDANLHLRRSSTVEGNVLTAESAGKVRSSLGSPSTLVDEACKKCGASFIIRRKFGRNPVCIACSNGHQKNDGGIRQVDPVAANCSVPASPVPNEEDIEFVGGVLHDTADASEPLVTQTEAVRPKDNVTKLRIEIAELRSRVASLLDENAAAAQREAELLRKLSKYEV